MSAAQEHPASERPLARTGATVVVTGGTAGIGLASATALAALGARVAVLGRDAERGARAVEVLQRAGAAGAVFVPADLSSLASVEQAVTRVRSLLGRPEVVVANAGGLYTDRWETVDGIEASLAMNLVSPVALVEGLTAGPGATRVVAVSTGAVRIAKPATDDPQRVASYPPMAVYGSSKLHGAAALLALGRERPDLDVLVVDPGGAATDMTAGLSIRTVPWFIKPGLPLMRLTQRFMTTERAARSTLAAASRASLEPETWVSSSARPAAMPSRLRDDALGTWSLELARTLARGAHPATVAAAPLRPGPGEAARPGRT